MRIAPVGIDYPFLAPGRRQLDCAFAHSYYFQSEPLMVRAARQQLLHVFDARNLAHVTEKPLLLSATTDQGGPDQGTTTTLPITSRSLIKRNPSAAFSSGNTSSITGLIFLSTIIFMRSVRLSS